MSSRAWGRRRGQRRAAVLMVTFACQHAGVPLAHMNALVRLFRRGDRATRLWVNQQIDDAITSQILSTNIAKLLLAEGKTIVSMDDRGRLVEHRPDGTSTVLKTRRSEALTRLVDEDLRLLERRGQADSW